MVKSELEEAQKELAAMKTELKDSQAKVRGYMGAYARKKNEESKAEENYEKKVVRLNQQIAQLETEAVEKSQSIKTLQEQLAVESEQLKQAQSEIEKLKSVSVPSAAPAVPQSKSFFDNML